MKTIAAKAGTKAYADLYRKGNRAHLYHGARAGRSCRVQTEVWNLKSGR